MNTSPTATLLTNNRLKKTNKNSDSTRQISDIDLPITFVLNSKGYTLFTEKGKSSQSLLSRFNVPLSRVHPPLLQKLLKEGCIKRIDVEIDDVIKKRHQIIDLSKLLIFGLQYKQFRHDIFKIALDSESVQSWNRFHPHEQITEKQENESVYLGYRVKKDQQSLREFEHSIMNDIWQQGRSLLEGDDQKKKLGLAINLVKQIHPLARCILTDVDDLFIKEQFRKQIIDCCLLYIKRYNLPEYTSHVLLEYLQYSERDTLLKEYHSLLKKAGQHLISPPINYDIRRELIKRNIKASTRFSYFIEEKNVRKRGYVNQIKTLIFSGNKSVEDVNKILFKQSDRQVSGSVRETLKGKKKVERDFNPQILFSYMTSLEETCHDCHCHFSSYVSQTDRRGESVTTFILAC